MNRKSIIESTIKNTYIWKSIRKLKLTLNMRLADRNNATFNDFLMSVGDGTTIKIPNLPCTTIEIPSFINQSMDISTLINDIYGKLNFIYF